MPANCFSPDQSPKAEHVTPWLDPGLTNQLITTFELTSASEVSIRFEVILIKPGIKLMPFPDDELPQLTKINAVRNTLSVGLSNLFFNFTLQRKNLSKYFFIPYTVSFNKYSLSVLLINTFITSITICKYVIYRYF